MAIAGGRALLDGAARDLRDASQRGGGHADLTIRQLERCPGAQVGRGGSGRSTIGHGESNQIAFRTFGDQQPGEVEQHVQPELLGRAKPIAGNVDQDHRQPAFGRQLPDGAGRLAGDDVQRRHIRQHDAVGADHRSAPDAHAGEHDAPEPEPGIVLDHDGALRTRGRIRECESDWDETT